MDKTRRDFLKFLGVSTYTLSSLGALTSCQFSLTKDLSGKFPSLKDDLILIDGLHYYPIISWGEKMNTTEEFGFNNDYITYHQLSDDDLLMWVNHEYANPLFIGGWERTKKNIDLERRTVGGSIIRVKKKDNKWTYIANDKYNKGVRADTPIPFANGVKIKGTNTAIGTCSNCAGGYTPWGTFLTCEENSHQNYGTRQLDGSVKTELVKWDLVYPHPPEHYGWVVEIEPKTAKAQKHINLGRFGHESATPIISKSNHVVVYSGDDKADEHVYKFVSKTNKDFKAGVLYVANLEQNKWLPIDLELSPVLKKHFKNHVELMINTREAAKMLGATPLNRPEDIEIHPKTKDVYITLTNNKKKGDMHGSILKISENNNDHSSVEFQHETFKFGGDLSKFSCPDNMAFDQNGNLWLATDISGDAIGKSPYKSFGNNGLFVIKTQGKQAGMVIQVASAPVDAEFTGLSFSPDQKTLFMSVQHPGELSKDIANPTSHWPSGNTPKPTVVAIEGKYLEDLTQIKPSL